LCSTGRAKLRHSGGQRGDGARARSGVLVNVLARFGRSIVLEEFVVSGGGIGIEHFASGIVIYHFTINESTWDGRIAHNEAAGILLAVTTDEERGQ
jgi:hypothetical protein